MNRAVTLLNSWNRWKQRTLWVKAGDQLRSTGSLTSIYPALLAGMEKVPEGGGPVTLQFQRQKGNYFHTYSHTDPLRSPWPGSLAKMRAISYLCFLMETGVSCIRDSQWVWRCCHSCRYTSKKEKKCLLLCHQHTHKKIPCCFQGPKQRNLLFVPRTKHPRCVYLQLTSSMVSRGRNSLQSLFVLTEAFIGKVQELTSLGRQEGNKRRPLEITAAIHTQFILSLA